MRPRRLWSRNHGVFAITSIMEGFTKSCNNRVRRCGFILRKNPISSTLGLCLSVFCLLSLLRTYEEQLYCPVIRTPVQLDASFQAMGVLEGANNERQTVGMVLALTTRGLSKRYTLTIDDIPLFRSMLPSFCKTCSNNFNYKFFISYDNNDICMTQDNFLDSIRVQFINTTRYLCPSHSSYSVQFLRCNHSRRVAWAQNDAVVLAHQSGVDFIYRINDDTVFESPGWTEIFIRTLRNYDPPNIGVVGPNHRRGNSQVLTYEFIHRTHVDIFGFHYPRDFRDWDADVWLTSVYQPGRVSKIKNVTLLHTMQLGSRYTSHSLEPLALKELINRNRRVIERYIITIEQEKMK